MTYKGFAGEIKYSAENNVYFGRLQNVQELVLFEGETIPELIRDFRAAVDDYLEIKKVLDNLEV